MMERSVSVVVDRFCYLYTNLHSSGSRSIELKSDGSNSFYPDKTKLVWKEEKGVKSQKCSNNKGQKILSNIFPAKKKATVLLSADELLSAIMKMAVYNGVVFFSHKKDFGRIWELPWEDFQWETIMNNFKVEKTLLQSPLKEKLLYLLIDGIKWHRKRYLGISVQDIDDKSNLNIHTLALVDMKAKRVMMNQLKNWCCMLWKTSILKQIRLLHTQLTTHFIHNWQRIGHDSHNPAYE